MPDRTPHMHAPVRTPPSGLARALRTLAGGAGVWRARRRGSFLVMVVGTLALLAVFTILYVTIGNQDVRAKAAQVKRDALDDIPRQFQRYVAQDIIAADATSVWYDPAAIESAPDVGLRVWRETTDYPAIDWDRRSDVSTDPANASHDPARVFNPVGTFDVAAAAAASTLPWRVQPTDPWLASSEPTWLSFSIETASAGEPPYLRRRDWKQVSNVAPDGRFVNLNRLRNNFRATHAQLTQGLNLFSTVGAGGGPTTNTFFGGGADLDVPAHWSAMQVNAYRPVSDFAGQSVTSDSYPPYQWVDADGDGFRDSRIFEMVDYRDRGAATDEMKLIESDNSVRWFFATRIVDLSGLLNVNAAGDLRAGPSVAAPIGTGGPAEADLRRLLTMTDAYDTNIPPGTAGGYDGILADPGLTPFGVDYAGGYDAATALEVGRRGYDALRMSLAVGFPLPPQSPAGQPLAGAAMGANFAAAFGPGSGPNVQPAEWEFFGTPSGTPFEVRRRQYWSRAAELFMGSRPTWMEGATGQQRVMGVFALDDQAELMTFFGANDTGVTSTLETVVGGRDPGNNAFSALRDNRSALAERGANRPLNAAGLQAALLQVNSDVRRHLTTVSGARQFRTRLDFDAGTLVDRDLKRDAAASLEAGDAVGLFAGYAESLAPFTHIRRAWDASSAPDFSRYATLFYGHRGPELALHVAAHAAANMKDLYDYDAGFGPGTNPFTAVDTNPRSTVYTLVLDDTFIDRTNFNDPQIDAGRNPEYFPAFSPQAVAPFTPRRDYFYLNRGVNPSGSGDNRLGSAASQLAAPLVNVYGIEPQAFITNISTFSVYSDAPSSANGDDEVGDGRSGATINGTIDAANPDFLYRAIAVQVTNPFDQPVDLSTGGAGGVTAEYYLRIRQPGAPAGTLEYYLAGGQSDASFGTLEPIQIPARSSVVLMITSSPISTIRTRIEAVDSTAVGTLTDADVFKGMVGNAMRDSSRRLAGVYWVPALDPLTGATAYPAGVSELIFTDLPQVELWRARVDDRRVPGTLTGDQLMDRLRMPASAVLNRRLPAGQNEISGSDPDDDGYTITVWASARRPADPSSDSAAAGNPGEPLGAFPAFCMEPKYTGPAPTQTTWNIPDNDGVNLASLSNGDFDGIGRRQGNTQSVPAWRNAMESGNPVVRHLAAYPGVHGQRENYGGAFPPTTVDDPSRRGPVPFFPATESYDDHYPVVAVDNKRFRRPSDPAAVGSAMVQGLRVGDLLLGMGIGPMNVPMDSGGTLFDDGNDAGAQRRWTTLAESLACAMGYENYAAIPGNWGVGAPPAAGLKDALCLYTPVAVGSSSVFPLDRGQLWLDQFTPFLDVNGNRQFDAAQDRRSGLEIPPALAILDVFDVPSGGARSLTKMVPGLININTATLPVLRTLPMLSPMTGTNPDNSQPNWWWNTVPPSGLNIESDMAATVAAYRDGVAVPFRPMSRPASNPAFADFFQIGASTAAPQPPAASTTYDGADGLAGRSGQSQVSALSGAGASEWPGLRTVAELLSARQRDGTPASAGWKGNLNFMGRNDNGTGTSDDDRPGVNSLVYQPDSAPPGTIRPDAVRDDYAEQLAAIQGVLGSTTARSDVFAVWFMVMGFREGDVTNLGANDPVVPSIKRRFLMIVDRSGVVKRGDKAEILLVRELPVEN